MATITGSNSGETLTGTVDSDVITALGGDDTVNALAGNDTVFGGDARDTLRGGSEDDTLYGEGDKDQLFGDAGNDILIGGASQDRLSGGAGNDTFVYLDASDSTIALQDVILDFTQGQDRIDLSALLGATDLAWGGTTPTPNGVWFQQIGSTTIVYVDLTGNTTADFRIQVNGLVTFTQADFLGVVQAGGGSGPVAVGDDAAAFEDSVLNAAGNVLANDSGTGLSITAVRFGATAGTLGVALDGTYGALTLNADGTYHYDLDNAAANVQALAQGQTVQDVFTYTVTNAGGSVEATLTVTITGSNDTASISGTSGGAVTEDATTTATGTLNASDVDSGEAQFQPLSNTSGTYGTFSITAGGGWTYVLNNGAANVQGLNAGQSVTDTFTVLSQDGTASQVVTITIDGADEGGSNIITGTNAGQTINGTAGADTIFALGGADTVNALGGADTVYGGDARDILRGGSEDDTLFGEGDKDQLFGDAGNDTLIGGAGQDRLTGGAGNDTFVYLTATDSTIAQQDVILDFTQGQDRIDLSALLGAADLAWGGNTPTPNGVWFQQTGGGTTIVYVDLNGNTTADFRIQVNGLITFTQADFLGVVQPGGGGSPPAPVADTASASEDGVLAANGNVLTNDAGAGLGVTAVRFGATVGTVGSALQGTFGSLTLNADGTYSYALSNSAANVQGLAASAIVQDVFTYTVSNADGDVEATLTVTITGANDAPTITAAVNANTDEDTAVGGTATGSDVDTGAALTYSATNGANSTVSIDANSGAWTYTPNANYNGGDSFTITVSDGLGGSARQTVNVTIDPVNDAPTASDTTVATNEDTALNGNLPAASDLDNDSVTYALGTGAANGTAVVNGDGSFSYTPDTDFNGADSFTYSVSDGNGGSNTYTVTVNVGDANDTATITGDDAGAVAEDVTLTATGTLTVSDPDAGESFAQPQTDTAGTYGTFSVNAAGEWSYALTNAAANVQALANGATVTDTFTVTSQDGSESQNVVITITGANDAPTITATVTASTDEDTAVGGTASGSDVDTGATLNYSATNGTNGTVSIDSTSGAWTYTPASNVNGTDSFTITVSDGLGGSAQQTVNVTIDPVNDAPSAADTTVATNEDETLNGNLPAATDLDNDGITYALGAGAANGTAVVNTDGSFSYTPNTDFNGADSFTYSVSDGHGGENTYTVGVNVAAVNDPAAISGDTVGAVAEDGALTASGTLTVTDPDAGESFAQPQIDTAGTYGTFSVNAAGEWSYALDNDAANVQALTDGEIVTDTFTVTSQDGGTTRDVVITITGAADGTSPPVLTPAALVFGSTSGIARADLSANDTSSDLLVQPDGKIVVAGSALNQFALARFNADGTLDAGFGDGGKVVTPNTGDISAAITQAVERLPDGKLIVAGAAVVNGVWQLALLRYEQNGTLDTSFGGGDGIGIALLPASVNGTVEASIVVQPDGKAIVLTMLSSGEFGIVRFNEDGSLDTDFGVDGVVTTDLGGSTIAYGIAQQADGKLVIAGYGGSGYFAVARFNEDGTPDTAFGTDGLQTTDVAGNGYGDIAYSLTIQADDKIVLAGQGGFATPEGSSDPRIALVRYNPDGSLDLEATTNIPGASFDEARSIIQQADGKLVVAGYAYTSTGLSDFVLVRYNADLTLDTSFGNGGIVVTNFGPGASTENAFSVVQQADGKLLVTGYAYNTGAAGPDFVVVRYNVDGTLDTTFGDSGMPDQTATPGAAFSLTIPENLFTDPDGGSVTYTVTTPSGAPLPDWLDYDAPTRTLSGTVPTDAFDFDLRIVATDGDGMTAIDEFRVDINAPASISGDATGDVSEDGTLSDTGSLIISDADSGEGFLLGPFSLTGAYGSLSVGSGGGWTYSLSNNGAAVQGLAEGQIVTDTFTVSSYDGTAQQIVVVTITGANDAPTIDGFTSVNADEDVPVGGTAAGADIDQGAVLSYGASDGASGTVSIDDESGAWTYTPNANFNGVDSFTITVNDGLGGSAQQTVNVTVAAVNDAPTASDTTVSTNEDETLNGNLPAATDVDNDTVTYALDTDATNGAAVVNIDGTYSYTPNENFSGTDAFTYSVSDGNGGSSTYTVTVNVEAVDDPPAANDDDVALVENVGPQQASGNLLANDTANGGTLSVTTVGTFEGDYGSVTIAADGSYTYTLDSRVNALTQGQQVVESFSYEATNGALTDSAALDITITGTNDAAVIGSSSTGLTLFAAQDAANGRELWVTDGTAAGTVLLKDIWTGTNGSNPSQFTALGDGRFLFTASDPTNGQELWVTDGTAAGTVLLRNIYPGGSSSSPQQFTALGNGRALFTAVDPVNGQELWVTDGTAAGTVLVKDINAGGSGSSPQQFTALGDGRALFTAFNPVNGQELWITDGTAAGTVLVQDIASIANSSSPFDFFPLGDGRLLFRANDSTNGQELWITDGTAAGTVLLKDIWTGSGSSNPSQFTALGDGRFLFSASDSTNGQELWVTDGTAAGTALLKNIYAGSGSSGPHQFTALGDGRFLFRAQDATNGQELWVTDGTAVGTVLLKDIRTGSGSSNPSQFTALGDGRFLFSASDSTNGQELWVTDGTAAGTVLLKDIWTGSGGSSPSQLTALGDGRFLFTAQDPTNGYELWVTDGTAAGTVLLKDIYAGAGTSDPQQFTALGDGQFLFMAQDATNGYELWVTDGTAAGTSLLKDIWTGSNGAFPQQFTALGDGRFLFSAQDPSNGQELWVTDGTAAGTTLLKDIYTGGNSSSPQQFTALGDGRALFLAQDPTNGYELWVTDGTAAGTALLKDIYAGLGGSGPQQFTALGDGRFLFTAVDLTNGQELWITDGTAAGTVLLKDIWTGSGGSSPSQLTALGDGRFLFTAVDPTNGQELWVTDGTAAGTILFKDLFTGQNTSPSSSPSGMTALGDGRFLFSAQDPTNGRGLWVTDGTAAGTSLLKDIYAGGDSSFPQQFTALGDGRALFLAQDPTNGFELWVTDGTTAGTVLLKDIWAGSGSSGPSQFIALGDGQFLFTAQDSSNGEELWVTDGTAAGTTLLKDIWTGDNSSFPQQFTALGDGRALFLAQDPTNGFELWVTDGTTAGTVLLKDIWAGSGSSSPSQFIVLGDGRALFLAQDPTNGYELWVTDGTPAGTTLLKDIWTGDNSSFPQQFTALGDGRFLFTAQDPSNGRELWVTDGTTAGTVLLKDVFAGQNTSQSSSPFGMTALGDGRFLFTAQDPTNGRELWVTDGTAAGTVLLKDIWTGSGGSSPSQLTALGDGRFLFTAQDQTNGYELWVTDGTAAGTVLLKDIYTGSNSSSPQQFTALGDGRFLFTAQDPTNGQELWVTDGTAAGTVLLKDIWTGGNSSSPQQFTVLGDGRVLFTAYNGHPSGYPVLWVTDGTSAGTIALGDIVVDPFTAPPIPLGDGRWLFSALDESFSFYNLWVTDGTVAGTGLLRTESYISTYIALGDGRLLFMDLDQNNGYELWITDGTAAGTVLLKDIYTGSNGSFPQEFVALGDGRFLFRAQDATNGQELWVTDGTAAGTVLLKDIWTGTNGSNPSQFTALGDGRFLFLAQDGSNGYELWVTDGTSAGTLLLKDIYSGPNSSFPQQFVALGDGRFLFRAQDATNGQELWVTDGTAAGTTLLKDIWIGSGGSFTSQFIALGDGRFLFLGQDATNGQELWVTDGTAAGTALLKDIYAGPSSSFPQEFVALGDGRFLFRAQDATNGQELWITDGTSAGTVLVSDIASSPNSSSPSNLATLLLFPVVVEAGGVANGTQAGANNVSGIVSISDPDAGQASFQVPANLEGTYGTFTFTAAGAWSYTLDPARSQSLRGGENVFDQLSITSLDGSTSSLIVVRVVGANDVADAGSLTGDTAGTVTEDGAGTANGQLSITDPDAGESGFTPRTNVSGTYGSFSVDATGAWTYTLNNSATAVQALGPNQQVTDSFTVTSTDGTASQIVTITVNGANDPINVVNDTALATEAGGAANSTAGVNPTGNVLTNDSIEAGETSTVTAVNGVAGAVGTTVNGTYGTLTLNANGSYTYTVDNSNAAVQALANSSQTLTDTFSYTASDGNGSSGSATLTVTVRGQNDAPTNVTLSQTSVNENLTDVLVGTLSGVDPDTGGSVTSYSIVGGTSTFSLRNGNQVVLNVGLDYETATTATLVVRATDNTGAFSDHTINVTVNDRAETTLTTGTDTVPAGPGDLDIVVPAGAWQSTDNVDGGGGNDTLILRSGSFYNLNTGTLAGIETIRLVNQDSSSSFNVELRDGLSLTVIGSASSDFVRVSTSADNVSLGNGDDTIYIDRTTEINSGDVFDGGSGNGTDSIQISANGSFDLTQVTVSNFEILYNFGSTASIKIDQATVDGVSSQLYLSSSTSRFTTDSATLNLSGRTITGGSGGAGLVSTNATGTTFTINAVNNAPWILGGTGSDTLVLTGVSFTAAQREQLFASTLIETITDSSGTYSAPALPGTVDRLTSGTDTVVDVPGGSREVWASSDTLSSGDSLQLDDGTDELVLWGGGTFNLGSPTALTGIEQVTLVNEFSGQSANVTLRDGLSVTLTGSNNAEVVNPGTGVDSISLGSGNDTINIDRTTEVNAGDIFDGGTGSFNDILQVQGSGAFDLTVASVSNFEVLYNFVSAGTVKIDQATVNGTQNLYLGSSSNRFVTDLAVIDLSSRSFSGAGGAGISSTNATGTTFTINSVNNAPWILGGSGSDTLVLTGASFTALQREQIFGAASIETIIDSSGTYTAPSLTGVTRLTSGSDVVTTGAGGSDIRGDASTLNFGDQFVGGAGQDVLTLYGAGNFNLQNLSQFSGIEAINLRNEFGNSTDLTLRNGVNITVSGSGGSDYIRLSSGLENIDAGGGIDFFQLDAATDLAAGDVLGGGGGTDYIQFFGSGNHDLTVAGISGVESLENYVQTGSVEINQTIVNGLSSLYVANSSGRYVTDEITLNLSGKSLSVVAGGGFSSGNATGTTFTINNANYGAYMLGGAGVDTVVLTGQAFSSAQRSAIFTGGSIEIVRDTSGIYGNSGNNVLTGTSGVADVFSGGAGDDTFVFGNGFGADRITDFVAGAASGDRIDLSAVTNPDWTNFADVQSHTTQVGADTVIDLGNGNTITLVGVTAGNLTAGDFVL